MPMGTFLAIGVWMTGVVVSFVLGNRKLPLIVFLIGGVCTAVHFTSGLGFIYTSIMAILAVIMLISIKIEMS